MRKDTINGFHDKCLPATKRLASRNADSPGEPAWHRHQGLTDARVPSLAWLALPRDVKISQNMHKQI